MNRMDAIIVLIQKLIPALHACPNVFTFKRPQKDEPLGPRPGDEAFYARGKNFGAFSIQNNQFTLGLSQTVVQRIQWEPTE